MGRWLRGFVEGKFEDRRVVACGVQARGGEAIIGSDEGENE